MEGFKEMVDALVQERTEEIWQANREILKERDTLKAERDHWQKVAENLSDRFDKGGTLPMPASQSKSMEVK